MTKYLLLTIFFICNLSIHAQSTDQPHVPLDIPLLPSGSFSEIRTNHYHTGVDFKTNGVIGLKVYSAWEGHVSRIYVSSTGYGKALYIDHPNGKTTVYGHLNGFNERIDAVVKSHQYKSESFHQNLFFEADELPVTKGEVIGFSGNAGSSGGPHLHYEVRDTKTEHPLNPLAHGIKMKDTTRPHFKGIKIYPREGAGILRGGTKGIYYPAVKIGSEFRLKNNPVIYVDGEIGIGAEVLDYIDGSWAKCGITEMEVYKDDTLVYAHNTNRLDFYQQKYMNSFIDYKERTSSSRRIIRAFKADPNNELSVYTHLNNKGFLKTYNGQKHEVKVKIKDFAGNTSTCKFYLRSKKYERPFKSKEADHHFLVWDKENTVNRGYYQLHFPEKTLFHSLPLEIEVENDKKFLSPKITVHKKTVPLCSYYTFKIKKPETHYPDSILYIGAISSRGNASPLATKIEDEFLSTSTKYFGSFAVLVDTIKPSLRSIDLHNGKRIHKYRNIRFKFSDYQSGVKRYRGEVDGKWVLFDFDAKSRTATYWLDEKRIGRNKKHHVNFKVTDNCGNANEYKADFYW